MSEKASAVLSKSRYLAGVQCRKRLWTEIHAAHLVPPPSAATRALFDQGHEVGRLATRLFPGGLAIDAATRSWDPLVEVTRKALSQRRPLFEAAFRSGGGACRVDILAPADEGKRWDVYEVKSSTSVKDVHLEDVAMQAWVVEGSGLEVRDYYLVHLDKTYVRQGELEPTGLFKLARISDEVRARRAEVGERLAHLQVTLEEEQRPRVEIGPHCLEPYECPLKSECWAFLPPVSVFDLIGARHQAFELLRREILAPQDLPETADLTAKQQIQLAAWRSGEAHLEREELRRWLAGLEHPTHYFDLETYAPALPMFDGSHPYQQIPFLFSVHRVEAPGQTARHYSYLVSGQGDPRGEFLRAVRSTLGTVGSIVAFHAAFERRVLNEAADSVGGFEGWVTATAPRFRDLLTPFRAFHYYHPAQLGNVSLKAVLPALTDMSYADLEISDGAAASREYLRVAHGEVEAIERLRVLRQLEEYCARDTLGMVAIVERLRELV